MKSNLSKTQTLLPPSSSRLFLPTVISRVLDPFVVLAFVSVVAIIRSGLSPVEIFHFLLIFFLGMVLPPASLLAIGIKMKKIGNWDISNRRQRIPAFAVLSVLLIIDYLLVRFYGNPYLLQYFVILIICFLGFFAVTLFWKISGHAAVTALGTGLLVYWWGITWWPLFLLVPLVGWARVVRRDHTVAQVVIGALYAWSVLLVYFKILGY